MFFVTPAFAEESTAAHTEGAAGANEVHTETGVPHDAGHEGGFPPFNPEYYGSQLLWLALSFGVFYLVMSKIVTPRIGAILEDRQDRIARDLDEASRMKAESDAAAAAFEKELADARKKAGSIAAEAAAEVKAKADAERAAVEASVAEKLAAAEKRISEIKVAALSEVGTIAEESVAEILKQVSGVEISAVDAAAAVKAVSN